MKNIFRNIINAIKNIKIKPINFKSDNIKKVFSGKRMKYGTNSAILTIGFIAILIVINLIVGNFSLKMDLTKNKLFSFSEQTEKVLKELNAPVNIYTLQPQGQENKFIDEVLDRYKKATKNIKIESVDPDKNPAFVKRYDKEGQGISNGSYIIESGEKFKVVRSNDLVQYSGGQQGSNSLIAEQRFTSAIMYVTSDKIPTVYFSEGHGETELPAVTASLETENYKWSKINILTTEIPEDADVIFVASPRKDFDSSEIEKLDKYFDRGGKAVFLFDVAKDNLPKLEDYLAEWGVSLNKDVVIEGDNTRYFQNPAYIIPEVKSHEITDVIKSNNYKILIPAARSLNILFEENKNTTVKPLISSSNLSWGKVNLESTTSQREQGDIPGPLDIAAAISRKNYDEKNNYKELDETKMLVMGNTAFLDQNLLQIPGQANMDFLLNGLNWMQGEGNKISIRPKSLSTERLNIASRAQIIIYILLVVIIIPLLVFVSGGIVWSRRRHL